MKSSLWFIPLLAVAWACAFVGWCSPSDVATVAVHPATSVETPVLVDPGMACLRREASNADTRTLELLQRHAELEAQVDVLSGAYRLRRELEAEDPARAMTHAMAVADDKTVTTPEQRNVAVRYLRARIEAMEPK